MISDSESSSSTSSSSSSDTTFIEDLLKKKEHKFLCQVPLNYIQDNFNLYGLKNVLSSSSAYSLALSVLLEDYEDIVDEQLYNNCRILYGLIHARYILTCDGLQDMKIKYQHGDFGTCPRICCNRQRVLPVGLSDMINVDTIKVYCPSCQEIYDVNCVGSDGAFIGTSFPHIFLLTYKNQFKSPPTGFAYPGSIEYNSSIRTDTSLYINNKNIYKYTPRIFGYKIKNYKSNEEISSISSSTSTIGTSTSSSSITSTSNLLTNGHGEVKDLRDLYSHYYVKYNHDDLFNDSIEPNKRESKSSSSQKKKKLKKEKN